MSAPPPSIGRVVHYVAPEGGCVAAIVVGMPAHVDDDQRVDLTVFGRAGLSAVYGAYDVLHDESVAAGTAGAPMPGTWHWPERV